MKRILLIAIALLCLAPAAFGQAAIELRDSFGFNTSLVYDPLTGAYVLSTKRGAEKTGVIPFSFLTRSDDGCKATYREEYLEPTIKLWTFTLNFCNNTGTARLVRKPLPGVSIIVQMSDIDPDVVDVPLPPPVDPPPTLPPSNPSSRICIVDFKNRGSLSYDPTLGRREGDLIVDVPYTLCVGGQVFSGKGMYWPPDRPGFDGRIYLKDETNYEQMIYVNVDVGLKTGQVTGRVEAKKGYVTLAIFDKNVAEGDCGGCQ